jgi:hypothetical protein
MASTLMSLIPQTPGLLPQWLLLVHPPYPVLQSDILANTTIDCVDIRWQLDPSIQHPALYVARVQPHIHRPAACGAETRHRAE